MVSFSLRGHHNDLWRDYILQSFEVSKAWDVYLGHAVKCQPGMMSPVQIQAPQHYVFGRRLAFLQSHELQKPQRAVRLLCLDPKQLVTQPGFDKEPFRVTACFDIGEQCLNAMGGPVVDEISQHGQSRSPWAKSDACSSFWMTSGEIRMDSSTHGNDFMSGHMSRSGSSTCGFKGL
ncbi:hypothetical protein MBLNU13_g08125t1 [Cladosporium sp. NU13]